MNIRRFEQMKTVFRDTLWCHNSNLSTWPMVPCTPFEQQWSKSTRDILWNTGWFMAGSLYWLIKSSLKLGSIIPYRTIRTQPTICLSPPVLPHCHWWHHQPQLLRHWRQHWHCHLWTREIHQGFEASKRFPFCASFFNGDLFVKKCTKKCLLPKKSGKFAFQGWWIIHQDTVLWWQ